MFVSPGSKRMFSSNITSPGRNAAASAATSGPTPSGASLTSVPSSSDKPLGDRLERQARVIALRPSEVGDEDERRAALAQRLDRRQRGPDPRVVGDPAALERNVEVDPDEHPLVP